MNPAAPSGREPGARHQPALEDNGRKQRNKRQGAGRVLKPQDVDGKAASGGAWGLLRAVQRRNANKEGKNPGLSERERSEILQFAKGFLYARRTGNVE